MPVWFWPPSSTRSSLDVRQHLEWNKKTQFFYIHNFWSITPLLHIYSLHTFIPPLSSLTGYPIPGILTLQIGDGDSLLTLLRLVSSWSDNWDNLRLLQSRFGLVIQQGGWKLHEIIYWPVNSCLGTRPQCDLEYHGRKTGVTFHWCL